MSVSDAKNATFTLFPSQQQVVSKGGSLMETIRDFTSNVKEAEIFLKA